jgi:vacuolar-type H+-ATPase subunit H
VAARRSVADADQRARWISAEALAAAEKKNRPCRGPRADDDA